MSINQLNALLRYFIGKVGFKTRHWTPHTPSPGKTFSADPSYYTDRTGWPVEMAFSTISAAIFTPPVFCSAFCILRAFSR